MLSRRTDFSYRTFGLELSFCVNFFSNNAQPIDILDLPMKPKFIIMLVVSIASISTASVLFLDAPSKYAQQKKTAPSSIEIKWGEGSEAGVPSSAVNK